MKNYNLIVTSAKLVPESMRNLGDLPAALYPIEGKTVLQRLCSQYDNAKEICVVTYENAEKFDDYLKSENTKKNINFHKLNSLKTLGETILEGIKTIRQKNTLKRIIINFGDTLVFENLEKLPPDGFYYSMESYSPTWTFFEIQNNRFTKIIDKQKNKAHDNLNIGKMFVGVFSFSDIEYLENCLSNTNNFNDMDLFYEALLQYNMKYELIAVKTNSWCDIGHQEKYYNAQLGVKAREFNHIVIDENRGILKKTSTDIDKFIGEILWYIKMPKDLEYASPRIFSYSLDYNNSHVSMEYYSYHTLHEILLYSDIYQKEWVNIFKKIKFICDDFARYSARGNTKDAIKTMYVDKTIDRLNNLKNNENFKMFFNNYFIINNTKYLSLNEIIEIMKIKIYEILMNVDEFKIIHGDLCFSNILVDSNLSFVKLIDPRGKFGEFDIYGDQRYEIAKLFHSIDGKYDYIIEELFDLNVEGNKINYAITEPKRDFNICNIFENVFNDYIINHKDEIYLIEALLFLSMISLHNESLRQQYVMFATGIEILSRCCDIKI